MDERTRSNIAGSITGIIQTFIFNPLDKAMYLTVLKKGSLFEKYKWINPYHGVHNAMFGKMVSYGYFFTLNDNVTKFVDNNMTGFAVFAKPFVTGIVVGSTTAAVTNPLNVVKFHAWATDKKLTHVARSIYSKNGIRPFFNGIIATINRDSLFTTVYSAGHNFSKKSLKFEGSDLFFADFFTALCATSLSSPFNYARNIQYKMSHNEKNYTILIVLKDLVNETIEFKTIGQRTHHIITKLNINWGTARVAVGISSGQWLYDMIKNFI